MRLEARHAPGGHGSAAIGVSVEGDTVYTEEWHTAETAGGARSAKVGSLALCVSSPRFSRDTGGHGGGTKRENAQDLLGLPKQSASQRRSMQARIHQAPIVARPSLSSRRTLSGAAPLLRAQPARARVFAASPRSAPRTVAMAAALTVKEVPTTPIEGQKTGTSGLRKKAKEFSSGNYLANWVQALFNALPKEDLVRFSGLGEGTQGGSSDRVD